MFSGIVESVSRVLEVHQIPEGLRLNLEKPSKFNDISIGDSICTDGVCLTIESFDDSQMSFVAAAETLQVTGWDEQSLLACPRNLERSLQLGARIHGHLVTGHVDSVSRLLSKDEIGESMILNFSIPEKLKSLIWEKGCICINGVSLTVNAISEESFSVCIVPETFRKTNLAQLSINDTVNLEGDYLAKSLISSRQFNVPASSMEASV